MSNDDTLRLVIAGRELVGFSAAQINMSIAELADTFSLTCPYDPNDKAQKLMLEPYSDEKVEIYIGQDIYLTGRIDIPDFHVEKDQRVVTIQGRSLPGVLVDCSAECDMTTQMTDLTFHQIAAKVCKSFGLKIRDDDSKQSGRHIPEARAEFGESGFDFLHKLAAPQNLILNSSYDGKLVITNADDLITYDLRAELKEGDLIFGPEGVRTAFDRSKRYTNYRIATSFCDVPDVTGEAVDVGFSNGGKVYRPFIKPTEYYDYGEEDSPEKTGTAADPAKTAARLMTECIASSIGITANLIGWRRPDGGRWSERENITLQFPSAYLYKSARYVISTLSLKLTPASGDDAGGYTSTLGLVPPEVYSSSLIKKKKQKVDDLW